MGEWVQRMPSGLDTLVGAGGRGLSAGEAQLLGLARVFLRDPVLVLLDEPSSRLDATTERMVSAALERLLEQRTVLMVAHRVETLDRIDEVLVLEEGRLLEHGRRERLALDPSSHFSRLQRSGFEQTPVMA